jgi:hypothetical protein
MTTKVINVSSTSGNSRPRSGSPRVLAHSQGFQAGQLPQSPVGHKLFTYPREAVVAFERSSQACRRLGSAKRIRPWCSW